MWKPIGAWKKALKLLPVSSKSIKALSGRLNISVSCCNNSWRFFRTGHKHTSEAGMFKATSRLICKRGLFLRPSAMARCMKRTVPSLSLFLNGILKVTSEVYFTLTIEGGIAGDTKPGEAVPTREARAALHRDLNQMEKWAGTSWSPAKAFWWFTTPVCLLQKWGEWDSPLREEVGHGCMRRRAQLVWGKISLSHSSSMHHHLSLWCYKWYIK